MQAIVKVVVLHVYAHVTRGDSLETMIVVVFRGRLVVLAHVDLLPGLAVLFIVSSVTS